MLQIRINENGHVLSEAKTLEEAKAELERILAEDKAHGADVEEAFYEIYDTETEEQLYENDERIYREYILESKTKHNFDVYGDEFRTLEEAMDELRMRYDVADDQEYLHIIKSANPLTRACDHNDGDIVYDAMEDKKNGWKELYKHTEGSERNV